MKKRWPRKRLDDIVIRLTNGYVGPTRNIYVEAGVPYLLARHVRSNELAFDGKTFITAEFNEKHKKSKLKTGDVLLVQSGHIGHSAVVSKQHEGHNCHAMIVITPVSREVSGAFLSLFFNAPVMQEKFEEIRSGSTVPHLTCREVRELEIPLPPLAEQQRIVGILDEAFEGIATAKANAEKNLQNARALFESHLQSVFTQRGDGWVEKRLGDVAEFKNGLNYNRSSNGQTLPVVGVGDFQSNYIVPIDELETATIDGTLDENYAVRRNDILTVRSNGSKDLVGRCMLVPDVTEVTSYSGFIIRIRFDDKQIAPRFLLHLLKSSDTRKRLTSDGGGANISNINQTKLSALPVAIPPFTTQLAIAHTLDELREETQRLESLYQRKLAALDELKKSLLHRAFSGEL